MTTDGLTMPLPTLVFLAWVIHVVYIHKHPRTKDVVLLENWIWWLAQFVFTVNLTQPRISRKGKRFFYESYLDIWLSRLGSHEGMTQQRGGEVEGG